MCCGDLLPEKISPGPMSPVQLDAEIGFPHCILMHKRVSLHISFTPGRKRGRSESLYLSAFEICSGVLFVANYFRSSTQFVFRPKNMWMGSEVRVG